MKHFTKTQSVLPAIMAASFSVLLASCGGGGGSDSTTAASDTTPAPATSATTPVTSPAPATGTTPTATPTGAIPGPAGQDASKYTLAFNDEFNSYDTSKWNDHIWYQTSNATKNYTVEDGVLKIWPQRDASGNFVDRTIDTDGKYYQTYGYFEMEAKLPVGKGLWPAFWLLNHDGSTRPEIDIMEAYSGGGPNSGWSDANLHPTTYGATVWPIGPQMAGHAGFEMVKTPDLSAGFHKYAVKWEPNKVTYYFDGQEVYSVDVTMPDRMYILLDLWYGSASGQPDNTTPTGKSNSYEVNYVRAWKFK